MNEYPLANLATIFGSKFANMETNAMKTYVSPELWNGYLKQFNWLFYEFGKIQCKICQSAYKKYSSTLECDEWTCPNDYNRVLFTTDNLILILKVHNFSDNHINAENILHTEKNNFVSNRPENGKAVPFMKWDRYLDRFPWLYVKKDNPGCVICEKAFELSKKMATTIWTDGNLQDPIRTDRPSRLLTQHMSSKNHRIAEDIIRVSKQNRQIPLAIFSSEQWESVVGQYPWLYYSNGTYHCQQCDVIDPDHVIQDGDQLVQLLGEHSHNNTQNNNSIVLSTDDEKASEDTQEKCARKPSLTDQEWQKLTAKYSWLYGENGWYYGCRLCQKGRKIEPAKVPLSNWTEEMLPFTDKVWYTYLVKKCYQHNVTQGHVTAGLVVASETQTQGRPSPQCGGLRLHFTTFPDGTAVCKDVSGNTDSAALRGGFLI